ncbi:hypothetical protein HMSSN139_00900 [Paenibacillus sp. HMSSN-139]|nr:hypothetical protein HMSSN139_00900 [Paenibacillus sp. HMSSN-139]
MPSESKPIRLNRFLVLTMAVTAGIAVANLYYIQPLLAEIAAAFHVTQAQVGYAATLTQVGYALGMLMILPLADIREKNRSSCSCSSARPAPCCLWRLLGTVPR